MDEIGSLISLKWIFLGIVGGVAKVFVQLNSMDKYPTPLRIVALVGMNAFVSGFSGFMGAVLISTLTPNDDYHVFAAGIAGYMGVSALEYFTNILKNKIPSKN